MMWGVQLDQLVSYLRAHDFIERDPAGYLKQMLKDAEDSLQIENPDFAAGFRAGMYEAANTLRLAATDHEQVSAASKKVLDAQANDLAAAILRSWANGLEINAVHPFPLPKT